MELDTIIIDSFSEDLIILGSFNLTTGTDFVIKSKDLDEYFGSYLEKRTGNYVQTISNQYVQNIDNYMTFNIQGNTFHKVGEKLLNVKGDMITTVGGNFYYDLGGYKRINVRGDIHNTFSSSLSLNTLGEYRDIVGRDQILNVTQDHIINVNKDEIINVNNEQIFNIGGSEYMVIDGDSLNITGKDNNLQVARNRIEKISGAEDLTVKGNYTTNIGGNDKLSVGGNQITKIDTTKTESIVDDYLIEANEAIIVGAVNVSGSIDCNLNGQLTVINTKGGNVVGGSWIKLPSSDFTTAGKSGLQYNKETNCIKVLESGVFYFDSFVNFNLSVTSERYVITRIRLYNCQEEKILLGNALNNNIRTSFIKAGSYVSKGTSISFEYMSAISFPYGLGAVSSSYDQVFSSLSIVRIN